jgi:hypothetical protein
MDMIITRGVSIRLDDEDRAAVAAAGEGSTRGSGPWVSKN